jgi:homopolymeric O-antigen transport system permease protein
MRDRLAVPTDGPSVLEVVGGPGGISRASLAELWDFREVFWAFTVRQVKVKYKQAAVGIGWAVMQPVLTAALFALFLGRLARVPSDGSPYLLFALTGMVAWTYFASAASGAMASLLTDQLLLRKVYFPREILPLAAVAAALVDLGAGVLTVAVASIFFGLSPGLTWLAIPGLVALLVASATAVGVGLSALYVYYRDVRYAFPPAWRGLYLIGNPIAAALDGFRRVLLHHAWPDPVTTAAALIWSAVLLTGGYVLFKRLERSFSDRI